MNPNYADEINFAYLDVGERYLPSYGPIKVRLRTDAVRARTTFLETNAYYFCKTHNLHYPSAMPPGHRALWADRAILAQAKLGGAVRPGMTDDELLALLLRPTGAAGQADFLEAHVYKPLHLSAIDRVWAPAPEPGHADMWGFIRWSLTAFDVTVEIYP